MKNSIILLIFVLTAALSNAQKQTPPAGGKPKDFIIPPKKERTLKNGLKSAMIQYGVVPKVTVEIIVKTGNVHEAANEIWLADLTAEMIREGSTSMDSKTIAEKVAAMGGEINSFAGMDQFGIYGTVLSEFAPELIKIMADMVMNPSFPSSEIDRLKNDLKRNLSVQKTRPQNIAREKFFSAIYKNHPYGRYYPTEEMLNSYTVQDVKGFYEKNFGAKRAVIYVAGKFDEEVSAKAIASSFENWKEGPEILYPKVQPTSTNEISLLDRKDAPQSTIIMGIPTLTPKNPDYQALAVTNTLLGGSFGSRITQNIREDKGYTYSPYSTIQNRQGVSVWFEQADVTSEHTGASLNEISKEITRLQTEAPTEQELLGMKNYSSGIFVLQNSNPFGIIGQLNFMDQHGLPDTYLNDYVKNIYAVTPEKVKQIANDHLKYEEMTMVIVGDKKLIEKQIQTEKNRLRIQ